MRQTELSTGFLTYIGLLAYYSIGILILHSFFPDWTISGQFFPILWIFIALAALLPFLICFYLSYSLQKRGREKIASAIKGAFTKFFLMIALLFVLALVYYLYQLGQAFGH